MPQGRTTRLTVALTPQERHTLETWQRMQAIPAGLARRARLLLLVADGLPLTQVADTVGISRRHVYTWVRRFQAQGLQGLHDLPRHRWPTRRRQAVPPDARRPRGRPRAMSETRLRYEPLPPHQPACTGCWQAPATVRVWRRAREVAALCDGCTREHRRQHRAVQGERWEEDPRG